MIRRYLEKVMEKSQRGTLSCNRYTLNIVTINLADNLRLKNQQSTEHC
jgi:hypothetical protein